LRCCGCRWSSSRWSPPCSTCPPRSAWPALLYPTVFALLSANLIQAGVDIGAIAAALELLMPIPRPLLVLLVTAAILGLQVFGSYRLIARVLTWLSLALLAYIVAGLLARPDLGGVLSGTLIPTLRLDTTFLSLLVATLGATVSPYLLFWQSSQEVEEELQMGRRRLWQRQGASDEELTYAAWDVNTGMAFAVLVVYFVMLATAATLYRAGGTPLDTPAEAAQALRPLAGDAAGLLLALGLVGSGLLAVPVLTGSAAYAVSEALGWPRGLDERPAHAREFYGVIAAATLIGMLVNFLGVSPIQALVVAGVIDGVLAPPVLLVVMLVANNPRVMGDRVNNRWTNLLGWTAVVAMSAAALGLLGSWLAG
jgi:Mn2+/Fe2+ NRAMP family transporter